MDKQDDTKVQERSSSVSYEKVALISHTDSEEERARASSEDDEERSLRPKQKRGSLRGARINAVSTSEDENDDESISSDFDMLASTDKHESPPPPSTTTTSSDTVAAFVINILHKNLLPDDGLSCRGIPILEGPFTTKLLKFVFWTFALVALIHVIVGELFDDRDRSLKLWHIWVFHGELMVRDMVVFFVVGRMWRQKGIDHLAFVGTALLSNMYFEAQNFMPFLQHSVTLYQMHCVWPWTLWMFVLVLIPSIGALVAAHVVRAHRKRVLVIKVAELALCFFFFVAPLMPSNYFHLHHWFAGWLIGMHANFDVWWSRFAMAWCWGMYINGIAVSSGRRQ
jgi:hypothetical protein